jgi:hypothetical protein
MAGGGIVAADNKVKDYHGGMLFGVSSMLAHADTAFGPCFAHEALPFHTTQPTGTHVALASSICALPLHVRQHTFQAAQTPCAVPRHVQIVHRPAF